MPESGREKRAAGPTVHTALNQAASSVAAVGLFWTGWHLASVIILGLLAISWAYVAGSWRKIAYEYRDAYDEIVEIAIRSGDVGEG